jgi:hypothetical protein
LKVIDGHGVLLKPYPPPRGKSLYFINLGAYLPGQFTEVHANAFVVAENETEVKKRAKAELLNGAQSVHTDDLYDIDDCLMIAEVDGQHIHLEPTMEKRPFEPQNGYHVIPREIVSAYAARRNI